jgi:hypothetical protein
MAWRAHPACPKHLVGALKRHINALPAAYLLPTQTGEVFDSIASCECRLRGYSMAQGFDIVLTGGGTRVAPGARFECCYESILELRNFMVLPLGSYVAISQSMRPKCLRRSGRSSLAR